jgi:TM2 domain-containing membrane protein YozV
MERNDSSLKSFSASMISKPKAILALFLALVCPGMGRFVLGSFGQGSLVFFIYVIVLIMNPIEFPWQLKWAVNFAVWSFFSSLDVRFVVWMIKRRDKSR